MMIARQASKLQPLWIAAIGLVVLPLAMHVVGLTTDTASTVVILAIAAMGLNLCVGYSGLVSFGHGAWFGIGAYAAAILQRTLVRRRDLAAHSLLHRHRRCAFNRRRRPHPAPARCVFLAADAGLAALTYTISFRWTDVTGGENGLGDLKRGNIGPISLDNALAYYVLVALIGLAVLYVLLRVLRSPFRPCGGGDPREPAAGHVPGLPGRALQARGIRAFRRDHRARPVHCSDSSLSGVGGRRLGRRFPANCWPWS